MSSEMGNVAAAQGGMIGHREPYWAELDDAGKIERLREQVKMLMRRVEAQTSVVAALREHEHHAVTGDLLVPLDSRRGRDEAYARRNDEYF